LRAVSFEIDRGDPGRLFPIWQRLPARLPHPARAPSFRSLWGRKGGIAV
jgi:hypothetical protein